MHSFCIHGHFYQPPREDPFTGVISPEKGASPFANFNEKINAECYRPNAELGNFEAVSFNLGPTLAAWLEGYDLSTYQRIVEANGRNRAAHGLGNALAQAYNHTILPLASRHDKETQILWGMADFRHRFGHEPLGMWLPEMAVDQETLEVLASQGIAFTLLSPHQARGQIDGAGPYRVRMPHGREMAIFFRDETLSNHLAFSSDLTNSAKDFAGNYLSGVHPPPSPPGRGGERGGKGLRLVATDGETFGHHHRGGDRFLHNLLYEEAPRAGYEVTFLARYLQDHPPVTEIEIVDGTSWSCGHGVARWREGCTCTQGESGWKRHLRGALDRLAQEMDALYQDEVERWVADPWRLRNGYIRVVLGEMEGKDFLAQQATGQLTEGKAKRILTLLEAQYYRQAMYTSCGFFFEDLSRLEPRYVIAYAAKAVHLVKEATDISLEEGFRQDLRLAVSWIIDQTGEDIYDDVIQEELMSNESMSYCGLH
jgi:alpha-amylase/alpha-mannosidase (GH57 family)